MRPLMRRGMLAAALSACALALPACGAVVGQTYHSIKGADGRAWMAKPIEGKLDRFTKLEIRKFSCEVEGNAIPAFVLEKIEPEIQRVITGKELFKEVHTASAASGASGDAAKLVVTGAVIDYEPGGSTGRLFGVSGERYMTARVQFIDGADGKVLGVGYVAGVVKGDIGRDQTDTCAGLGKGLADVVKEHRTPPEKNAK